MKDDAKGRKEEIRRRTIETRGYWNPSWDAMLDLSPEFTAAYVEFSGIPWTQGVLEPKIKELIYVAIDASTTHLHLPGLRNHIAAALRAGATKEEIIEVLQLTSVLGIHTATMGMPILAEELDRFEADAAGEE